MSFLIGPMAGGLVAGGVGLEKSSMSKLTDHYAGLLWVFQLDSHKVSIP